MNQGWKNEPYRHSLASRGVVTREVLIQVSEYPPMSKLKPVKFDESEAKNVIRAFMASDYYQNPSIGTKEKLEELSKVLVIDGDVQSELADLYRTDRRAFMTLVVRLGYGSVPIKGPRKPLGDEFKPSYREKLDYKKYSPEHYMDTLREYAKKHGKENLVVVNIDSFKRRYTHPWQKDELLFELHDLAEMVRDDFRDPEFEKFLDKSPIRKEWIEVMEEQAKEEAMAMEEEVKVWEQMMAEKERAKGHMKASGDWKTATPEQREVQRVTLWAFLSANEQKKKYGDIMTAEDVDVMKDDMSNRAVQIFTDLPPEEVTGLIDVTVNELFSGGE